MTQELILVTGNHAWSSWSLRPWLALMAGGLPFLEENIALRQPDTAAQIVKHSPSGRVPVLKHAVHTIWDSLAICEYAAELAPEARLWPEDQTARAVARAVSAEMHSGFGALRKEFPMDFNARIEGREPSVEASANIRRIAQIWRDTRDAFGGGGPFLFGGFTIADCMYAPVATRFRTYAIDLSRYGDDGTASEYERAILALPAMKKWGEGVS